MAHQRGYSEEKVSKLFLFINELMRLAPPFNQEFKNHISQSYKSNPVMFKYSQDTIDVVNIQTQGLFGTTVEAEQKKSKKAIIYFYKKLKMSIAEIAEFFDEEPKVIHDMLVAEKVIKS